MCCIIIFTLYATDVIYQNMPSKKLCSSLFMLALLKPKTGGLSSILSRNMVNFFYQFSFGPSLIKLSARYFSAFSGKGRWWGRKLAPNKHFTPHLTMSWPRTFKDLINTLHPTSLDQGLENVKTSQTFHTPPHYIRA